MEEDICGGDEKTLDVQSEETEFKREPAQRKREVPGPLLGLWALGQQSVNNCSFPGSSEGSDT